MTCPICDQKMPNCDCTQQARELFEEKEQLECELLYLRERVINSEALFRKYIAYIRYCEATDHVLDNRRVHPVNYFTGEEWKTLKLIASAS